MKHVFETDADNATINPLYIQKNTSVETTTTETNIKLLSYRWIIFRAILFLIIPIIVLWLIPNYHHLYVYIWICYVLIAQAAITFNIIDENNNNIYKRLVIFVILFLVISIIISLIPDTMVHNKETHMLKNNYKSCEWYTKEELPICDGYFKNGVSKILASPTKDKGGKSMSRDGILKIMKLVDGLLLGSGDGNSFVDQCPIILSFVCQSIISPCNSACQPSKMSSAWCIETITNDCIKEKVNSDISKLNSYFSYTFL